MLNFLKLNTKPNFEKIAPKNSESKIPKIIHQTYFTSNLPQPLKENAEEIKRANPNWNYKLYDDEDVESFILQEYGIYVLNYYNKINKKYGAARADLFRYLLMYRFGGVYIDIKSKFTRPLDSIIDPNDSYILSHWSDKNRNWGAKWEFREIGITEFQQCFIICSPGHPFLKSTIEYVLRNIDVYIESLHGVGKNGVLRVTGPIAYTLAIWPMLNSERFRMVSSETDLGFVYSIFDGKGHENTLQNHYSKHFSSIIIASPSRKFLSAFIKVIHPFYKLISAARNAKSLRL